jgi:hypothetical protein
MVGIFSGKRGGLFIGGRGRARGWLEVGAGAVSVEAAVAGRVGEAWAASAGVGVMSVACWLGVVTDGTAGSSTTYGSARGQVSVVASPCLTPVMEGGQRGMVRESLVTAESK